MRNFSDWISKFRSSISSYKYYIDFNKVVRNVENVKIPLNILNSLIGSENVEEDFEKLIVDYPEVLKCIPLLLAVRSMEIYCTDDNGEFLYNFKKLNQTVDCYKYFMRETGLFDMISNHIVNNLVDYALGIETGLDSNGRKNRGGHLMEDLVEKYILKAGFIKNVSYFKEMYIKEIEEKWGLNLDSISNNKQSTKRFDFVVVSKGKVFAIETNFYASGGSKLNETARSYKMISSESKDIEGFEFIWITDGLGWKSAKRNLQETFDVMDHIYSINDLESDILVELLQVNK